MLNKTTVLRRMISSKDYYSNRMAEMDRKCAFYLDRGVHASNKLLRDAFIATAAMYNGRYVYYFNKISGNGLRKSVQENPRGQGNVQTGTVKGAEGNQVGSLENRE